MKNLFAMLLATVLLSTAAAGEPATESAPPGFDAALAARLGADEHGMRSYVLVILRTGPNKHAPGAERDEIFKGHFANMSRLAAAGQLAVAGPLDGVDGWRGLFVLAARDIAEAQALAETDPVLKSGEMTADFHTFFSSAALMQVNETHAKIARKSF